MKFKITAAILAATMAFVTFCACGTKENAEVATEPTTTEYVTEAMAETTVEPTTEETAVTTTTTTTSQTTDATTQPTTKATTKTTTKNPTKTTKKPTTTKKTTTTKKSTTKSTTKATTKSSGNFSKTFKTSDGTYTFNFNVKAPFTIYHIWNACDENNTMITEAMFNVTSISMDNECMFTIDGKFLNDYSNTYIYYTIYDSKDYEVETGSISLSGKQNGPAKGIAYIDEAGLYADFHNLNPGTYTIEIDTKFYE